MAIHGADVWRNGKPLKVADFSSNVNPLAPPPGLMKELRRLVPLARYYPEPDARSARKAVAEFHGIPLERAVLGNGSNEIIHLIMSATKSGKVLIIAPTYSEYEAAALGHGLQPYFHVLSYPFEADLEKVDIQPGTSLIFLCNPNNPTGRVIPRADLMKFLSRAKSANATLVVDEVHMDLSDREDETLVNVSDDNLIVLRSLTKLLGVPGLRVGYAVSSPRWVERIDLVRPSWNVNVLAAELVKRWLSGDFRKFVIESKQYVARERESATRSLKSMGLDVVPSNADYLLIRLPRPVSRDLKQWLLERGQLIRDASTIRGLDAHYVRIGLLSHKKNLVLLKNIRTALKDLAAAAGPRRSARRETRAPFPLKRPPRRPPL